MVLIVCARETEELGMAEGEAATNAERDARVACDIGKRADRCFVYSLFVCYEVGQETRVWRTVDRHQSKTRQCMIDQVVLDNEEVLQLTAMDNEERY
jgi:hypothetical protein